MVGAACWRGAIVEKRETRGRDELSVLKELRERREDEDDEVREEAGLETERMREDKVRGARWVARNAAQVDITKIERETWYESEGEQLRRREEKRRGEGRRSKKDTGAEV